LSEAATPLTSARRLKDIYSKYLASPEPAQGPGGLQRFGFRDDSGYANQDLFVGKDAESRMLLIVCDRVTPLIDSPNCTRSLLLGPNLELTYRYKLDKLDDWLEIDSAVTALVGKFETRESVDDLQGTILD
jgi:hypothetical protein